MISRVKRYISRHLTNLPGWRTNRKIVVFESDDWGSIRMSSKANLLELHELGINIKNCPYLQNDALASEDDLKALFELLNSYKENYGKKPVITANVILTNPDFKKIEASGFTEYHNELFTRTLKKYPKHKNSFRLWEKGLKEGIFYPQFHGREHLQVIRWMNALKNPNSDTRKAFNRGVFGLSTTVTVEERKSYMASYDWDDESSKKFILKSIDNGLVLFKSVFGFESLTSIAPNYIWHGEIERALKSNGVRYIQGNRVQKIPIIGNSSFKKKRHYTGEKNNFGQFYLVRNCNFEPSLDVNIDWVSKCLNEIRSAFFWNKPAIISMHRVNLIGFINEENRYKNLTKLNHLLNEIFENWPEVEFMTSDELGEVIERS